MGTSGGETGAGAGAAGCFVNSAGCDVGGRFRKCRSGFGLAYRLRRDCDKQNQQQREHVGVADQPTVTIARGRLNTWVYEPLSLRPWNRRARERGQTHPNDRGVFRIDNREHAFEDQFLGLEGFGTRARMRCAAGSRIRFANARP